MTKTEKAILKALEWFDLKVGPVIEWVQSKLQVYPRPLLTRLAVGVSIVGGVSFAILGIIWIMLNFPIFTLSMVALASVVWLIFMCGDIE